MHDTFRMNVVCRGHELRTVALRNAQVRIAHSRIKQGEYVAVSEPHTVSDGIMNHSWCSSSEPKSSNCDIKEPNSVASAKPDVTTTVPDVRLWSDQLVSYRL
jgi:hypothetical protein